MSSSGFLWTAAHAADVPRSNYAPRTAIFSDNSCADVRKYTRSLKRADSRIKKIIFSPLLMMMRTTLHIETSLARESQAEEVARAESRHPDVVLRETTGN